MHKTRTTLAIITDLLALVMVLLVTGCANLPAKLTPAALQTPPGSSARTKPMPPIEMDLNMRGRPTLGATVQVDLLVKLLADAPSAAVTLTLPAGSIELAGGETVWQSVQRAENPAIGPVQHAVWQGSSPKGEATVLTTALRITQNGYYQIHAYAYIDLGIGGRYGNFADLYLLVDGAEAWVGKQPPKNNWTGSGLSPAGTLIPPESSPIQGRLYLTGPLALDQETELIYEIAAAADLDNLTVGITLPRKGLVIAQVIMLHGTGLTLLALERDPMLWQGRMVKGERIEIRVRLKPVLTGEGAISAFVSQQTANSVFLLHYDAVRGLKVYVPRLAD